ncbi:MAG: phosphonate C-P lyase system protein PhnG [Pelagibaca sp.]
MKTKPKQSDMLTVLARADAARIKPFAETLIAPLGEIDVLQSRTGLVMLPMRDTAGGATFHLGEVLVSEAHVTRDGINGYGMRRGRDLEAAMAMALIDLALACGIETARCDAFCADEATRQAQADRDTLRRVQATRVDMETF